MGILERIRKEDEAWRKCALPEWEDEDVGFFVTWFKKNVSRIEANPMFTTTILRAYEDKEEELERLFARCMIERDI